MVWKIRLSPSPLRTFSRTLRRAPLYMRPRTLAVRAAPCAYTHTATPPSARMQPDRERARQAAIELWGKAGPPDHLSNSSICREVAQWLKKNGQAAEISEATILRAVSRR
jgi:hypothetical protein